MGNGAEAVLRPKGLAELRAVIVDISRGGVSLRTDWSAPAGMEVGVLLQGLDTPVTARTVRTRNGVLALAFRQDEAMLTGVDTVLTRIGAMAASQKAA
jgi:PilZ domain